MKTLIKVITFLSVIAMTACSSLKPIEVNQVTLKINKVPAQLTDPCIVQTPVEKKQFLAMKQYEREQILSDYIVSLYGTVATCNDKLKKIRQLLKENADENKPGN